MRLRGIVTKGLLVAMILTLLPITAFSAQKIIPGSTCKKEGLQQLYLNKNYTCIKLGKKLYWNNGVAVVNKKSPQIATPATCTIQNFKFRPIAETVNSNTNGQIIYSADIFNSSTSHIASDIKIYIEWYDGIGVIYKYTSKIRRIYPGQVIQFGGSDFFQNSEKYQDFPNEPDNITIRSSCKSIPLDLKEFINGKPPFISGIAPVVVETFTYEIDEINTMVSANLIITNIFSKDMFISNEPDLKSNAKIYGVFKDKFGNILAGYAGYVSGDSATLETGELAKINMNFFYFYNKSIILDKVNTEIIKRITIFVYTIMLD